MNDAGLHLERTIPAENASAQALCLELRSWLRRLLSPEAVVVLAFPVELVAREAIQNALEHGCRHASSGWIRLLASIADDTLRVVVSDNGAGFDFRKALAGLEESDIVCSGNGLRIIAAYTAGFEYKDEGRMLVADFNYRKEKLMQDSIRSGVWAPQSDIVADNCQEAKETLRTLVGASSGEFVVDLSAVGMIDSKGLGILIAVVNSLEAAGRTLRVTGANGDLVELFRMMRLDKHMAIG
jgi:anti-anti-sigma factor